MRLFGRLKYILITGVTLVIGMLREILIASHYGLSPQLDAYAAVFGFYIFFGNQIANTLEATFIARNSHIENKELINNLFSAQLGLFVVTLMFCLVLNYLADQIVGLIFKLEPTQLRLSANIIRLFIPAMILASFVGLFRAVLNIKGIHSPGFLYGSIVSISVIAVMLAFYQDLGIYVLPIGYAVGNFFTLIVFFTILIKKVIHQGRFWSIHISNPFTIWRFAILVLVAEIIFQFGYLTERSIASGFGEGAIAAYFYAVSILMVFSAMVIQPVSTVIFPIIARKHRQSPQVARQFVLRVCFVMVGLGTLVAWVMFYLSPFIVDKLLVRGNFSHEDAIRTASLLKIMVFVLPFMSVSRVIKNSLYSKGNYRIPIFANLLRWLSLLAASPFFIKEYGVEGLAMVYVFSTALIPIVMSIKFFSITKKEVVS